jgi:hypothetical protein
VDGLVLGKSETHFGNELKIKLGDETEDAASKPEPFKPRRVRHPREFQSCQD